MFKKIMCLVTSVAFFIFSLSCNKYTTKVKSAEKTAGWKKEKIKVIRILKTSGEKIEFSNGNTGKIVNDSLIINMKKEIEILRANIANIKRNNKGKIYEVRTKDSKKYQVIDTVPGTDTKRIILVNEKISIPLSEVELIWVKRVNPGYVLVAAIVVIAIGKFFIYLFSKFSYPGICMEGSWDLPEWH